MTDYLRSGLLSGWSSGFLSGYIVSAVSSCTSGYTVIQAQAMKLHDQSRLLVIVYEHGMDLVNFQVHRMGGERTPLWDRFWRNI